jgi:glycolate oxidase
MALSRDVYRELEDIVGPENMSDDMVVLDGYACYQMGRGLNTAITDSFLIRPEAVVLPGSAEEVQKIIKLCNRRGIKAKASSTGYGPQNAPGSKGTILLDMRRMNRILELDEKNMYAVVEPYVSFAQVQAEAMKRGLNTHIIGAGCQVSYLASHTSMVGNNTQAISHGYSGRNLLGVEWVLPTGEMLRLGSPGSGAGWFSGDGPGPSLRGIMRGAAGASGGLGVFTKCAAHLHPWPGPTELEVKGVSPYYETELPPLFEYHVIEWPTWEQCADAQYKIGGAGIAFAMHKTGGPGSHGSIVTGSNDEYYEKWDELKQIPEVSWAIVLAANSPGEHEYQVKVLDKILEDTGGKITPLGEKRIWKNRDYINMIRACFIPRLAFRLTGTFTTDGMMGQETVDNCALALKLDGRIRDKYVEKGAIMNDGTYNNWGVTYEGAHFGLLEGGYQYNPLHEESIKGMMEMIEEGSEIALKTPVGGLAWTAIGARAKELGPHVGNPQNWMLRIKKAFDPNTASDPVGYISAEEA